MIHVLKNCMSKWYWAEPQNLVAYGMVIGTIKSSHNILHFKNL